MAKAPIHVYDPRISVKLLKNIARESISGGDGLGAVSPASGRFKGINRVIDLTPYLGESGGVRTSKSVRDPAGGFNITLADRMLQDSGQMESLYGLIEPMDMIEIRMAHAPTHPDCVADYQLLPEKLPIVMRGFISSIRRSEMMSADGKPSRAVVISGQDYGKLWQMLQIRYLANYVLGQELLTTLKFAQNYGVNSNSDFTPNQFVFEVIQQVLNKFTSDLRTEDLMSGGGFESPVKDVEVFDLTVGDAKISPFGVNSFSGGTLHQMLSHYGDVGPWNELFLEDREEGVAVVYRPNPFFSAAGEELQAQSKPFDTQGHGLTQGAGIREVSIADSEVVSLDTGRTDANVANYFWVDNPSFSLVQGEIMRLQAGGQNPDSYFIKDYRNCAPWLYGIRMMQLQTNQGQRIDGQGESVMAFEGGALRSWLDERRRVIVRANRDNVVFESGSMTISGNERLRAGMYLNVRRGNLEQKVYCARVDQNFMPFRTFTTTISFERGTGFIERAKRNNGRESPYLNELNPNGAYGGRK
jgi:hypothetical protein